MKQINDCFFPLSVSSPDFLVSRKLEWFHSLIVLAFRDFDNVEALCILYMSYYNFGNTSIKKGRRMRGRISSMLKPKFQYSGFLIGVACALAGSAFFTIVEMVRNAIGGKEIDPITYMLVFIFCCVLFFIPAGLGGTILGLILQNHFRKGSLTLQSGTLTGLLLWGLAGIITCVIWVWFAWRYPPHYPLESYNLNLHNFLATATPYMLEILTGIMITCIAGGWAGRTLATQLLYAKQ